MKNFRKVALAMATATTVAFAGTAVASAETTGSFGITNDFDGGAAGSSNTLNQIGKALEADTLVTGQDLFGSVQDTVSPAAQLWKFGTYALVAGAIAGIVIGIANEMKFQGLLPHNFPF